MKEAPQNLIELKFEDYAVLIVDDNPTNLAVMSNYLKEYGFRILVARNGESGLKKAQYVRPDIILLDVMMPGIDGFETCRRLKEDEVTRDIPVILLTALTEPESKVKGFEAGAVDYVTKPLHHAEVLARVTAHLKIRDLTRSLQEQNEQLQEVLYELQGANMALSKRAVQLEASNQVGQQVTSILDLDRLLAEVAKSIQSKFGYYFVGVWLLSEEQNGMILQAAIGRDRDQLLKEEFSLELDPEQSIIAWVCKTGEAYQAEDVSVDVRYVALEALPETHSQLALPLRVGEERIGVLDIQNDQLAAFTGEDQQVLQTLANQIAIAIRNARLYEVEKMLRSMEEEKAETLAKLNADKDKFFSIISHDLRGPFTNLLGNAQFMLDMIDELSKQDILEMTQSIYNGAKAAYGLLDNLLTWSRMQRQGGMEYYPEEIGLQPLAQETVELLSQMAGKKGIELNCTIEEGVLVYADKNMINTVIRNLASNALKFTPQGGTVTISAQCMNSSKGDKGADFVQVLVIDTGIGMSQKEVDQLFRLDVNHSTLGTDREEGSGLGLIICKEMVERNGGEIWVRSEVDEGTAVEFTVPQVALSPS
jgi:signal transduction histidine kinase/CheY-like chemotaxis protein